MVITTVALPLVPCMTTNERISFALPTEVSRKGEGGRGGGSTVWGNTVRKQAHRI